VGLALVGPLFALLPLLWRRAPTWAVPVAVAAVIAAGVAVAQGHALSVAAPVLERPLGPVDVAGRVVEVEPHDGRWRVTLAEPEVERLPPEATPSRLRLTLYDAGDAVAGARTGVPARLLPPPPPAAPGAFDFPRQAWFERLGAVGYAVGVPRVLAAAPPSPLRALADWVTHLRLQVAARLREGIGGGAGAVAAALATGQRGAIPEDVIEAYRASGLAHLLAISGLHMGLAAGIVFVVLRAALALVPPVALRWDIKKATAGCAMAAMAAYLALSGGNVPAQRAFVMGLVAFGAILADRQPVTLRVLAVAAVVVLLWQPDALVGASFQMSFAAVVALVAAYEVVAPRLASWRSGASGPVGAAGRAAGVYLLGILASTAIAGLATAPFAAFHFHRIAVYGVVANLLAMPVVSLWVMPWLALALLLMPFGLDGLAHLPLRWGLDAVEAVARMVTAWPEAQLAVPPMPVAAPSVVAVAGLWLCLNRGAWRWAALPVLAAALATPWLLRRPLVVVSGDGGVMAVRSGAGMVLSPGRGDGFTRDLWVELWGAGEGVWGSRGLVDGASGLGLACDGLGCFLRAPEATVALVGHPAAVAEDCAAARVVVATIPVARRDCPADLVVSKWDLWREGAHALYVTGEGRLRVETVAAHRGDRLWSRDNRRW